MNTVIEGIDYGPLAQLVGRWVGSDGMDKAPEADGETERNPFVDELVFSVAGGAENAEEQELVAVKYHHVVRKQSNGQIFHDQIGHWLFEPATGRVMHSLSIPRGVTLLAGGRVEQQGERFEFKVEALAGSDSYGIAQSPFMLEKAKTTAFKMEMTVEGDKLSYREETSLFIYGKAFSHVDKSVLQRVRYDVD